MPRRIAVTGTRGKSGVTRLVAAGLRASGARVLAKTTGSKPVLIFPDGTEREIRRAGPASIREQVRLVALAASIGADALVAEMMSIGGECLAAESRSILRPGTLAVTNVRLDHLDAMGRDRAAVARTLASAVAGRAEVFIPEEETDPAFAAAAARRGATLRAVVRDADRDGAEARLPLGEFEPNRRLALAVLESLGIDRRAGEAGMSAAAPDPGSLRLWRGDFGAPPRPAVCVNLFAANEPASSAESLRAVEASLSFAGRPLIGLLSLREDRGDRTLQWIRAAREGFFLGFAAVALVGSAARPARRGFGRASGADGPAFTPVGGRTPAEIMDRVMALAPGDPVVVGLGNFVGPGEDLVRFWERKGTADAG
ncbi:MAG: Mur ligase family protein [Acidobacteriota bacterium]